MAALPHFTELCSSAPGWLCAARPTTAGRTSPAAGLTLIEMLLTIAVLAILAAVLIPQISSDIPERLGAAAQVVAADIDYARALAVSNDSQYQITFEPGANRYFLTHAGQNSLLNALPRSPFRQHDDAVDRQTTDLSQLPIPKPVVRLAAVVKMQSGGQSVAGLKFFSNGGTTAEGENPYDTVIWLTCGTGTSQRYIPVTVNPLTGLAEVGRLTAGLPAAVATIAATNVATEATKTGDL